MRITRRLLEVLSEHQHPVTITTKGIGVLDDLDLLADMARRNLVSVALSITTMSDDLKRKLEPRTPSAAARLRALSTLRKAGIPVGVMTAPIIPAVNDAELEVLLEAAAEAGAERANWILLRLPNEVAPLFSAWLDAHVPDRADHVMSLVRQSRGGRFNDPRFGARMRGQGVFAELIADRFRIAARELGLSNRSPKLDVSAFRRPSPATRTENASNGTVLSLSRSRDQGRLHERGRSHHQLLPHPHSDADRACSPGAALSHS